MSALPSRPLETALHVRVAEALGWSQIGPGNSMNMGDPGIGYPPRNAIVGHKEPIPRYDTDWSATGPLIEEYWIVVEDHWRQLPNRSERSGTWIAHTRRGILGHGPTPLAAICNLILALKASGKL